MTLVLVWMGVSEPGPEFHRMAGRLGASTAFLQMGDPPLHRELGRLADAGERHIDLVGVAVGDTPGNSWLRRVAAHWWRERLDPPKVMVAAHLVTGEGDDAGELLRRGRPVTGEEPGLDTAAHEEVPRHHHQVFVCRGPRCTALGADRTAAAMKTAVAERGWEKDDVLVTQTGCQKPCNHGPVVSVQPDDAWYGPVDADLARTIVDQHLAAGRPLEQNRLARRPAR